MNPLLQYWHNHNYRISYKEAGEIGITNLDKAVSELRSIGIPIKSEIRYDLGESARRYWIDEEYLNQNK